MAAPFLFIAETCMLDSIPAFANFCCIAKPALSAFNFPLLSANIEGPEPEILHPNAPFLSRPA